MSSREHHSGGPDWCISCQKHGCTAFVDGPGYYESRDQWGVLLTRNGVETVFPVASRAIAARCANGWSGEQVRRVVGQTDWVVQPSGGAA